MDFKRAADILKILSSQVTETITASGSGQIWYETDVNKLSFMTPFGEKTIS